MKNSQNGRGAQRLWRGLTAVTASVLALALSAQPLVNASRTDIDKFLGTQSSKTVTDDTGEKQDLFTYKSDYAGTGELLNAIEDLGERMSEEGTVLLKNNGALPLSAGEKGKVSLLGFSSYYPVRGGIMGSSFIANQGTDADTVDLVQALTAKCFTLNPDLQPLYQGLESVFTTEVQSWGGTITYTTITAPSIGGVFSSKEPSQAALNGANASWKDGLSNYNVMIVTIALAGSENGTYLPGEAGVDPSQNLNQTDPLGLSDDERDLIQAAIDAKGADGKVIVLLNSSSAMEVQELEDNAGVDAILQIGLPGGYGFYGVADVLSGDANPSGHLADTYAADIASSPAAQNFGNLEWTNPDPSISLNSAIVQAEGIYMGYKYYETRYADAMLGQGNAGASVGSSTGSGWSYDDEVTYPFGFGLSYTTFAYSELKITEQEAVFTLMNTGNTDGAEVAQLYVSKPDAQVFRPTKELKGFTKVFLKAGESKTVAIPLDDKAFRYFNVKTNQFEVEGGGYQILIGASAADIRLSGSVTVSGTNAPNPYDSKELACYYGGNIHAVPDRQFEVLLGHPIPDGSWSGTLNMNDAICQMYYAKSWPARQVHKIMTNMLNKSLAKGTPDLNITFIYNMPFRGIAKMTGGMCTMEMAEGILTIVNGHFFKGLGRVIGGFFRAGKKRKAAAKIK